MASTQKQIDANRENAKKSTGPRSAIGKKRAAQNALKHGLTSSKIGLDFIEKKRELDAHRTAVLAFYNPQNAVELHWVDQIIVAQWRMNQLARWESGMFNEAIKQDWQENANQEDQEPEDLEQYITNIETADMDTMHNSMIANGMAIIIRQRNGVQTFLRYQSQANRLIRNAEDHLAKLRNEAKISAASATKHTKPAKTNEPNSPSGPVRDAWQPTAMPQ